MWVFEAGTFVPAAKIKGDKRYSIVADYLGTPVQMYDSQGKKTWECELDLYGKVRTFEGSSLKECPFRYQGQYEDKETGLYYNRFRYYDSSTGIYLSQDPIGLAGNNPTLYGYVEDTNIWLDPFGLDCSKKTSYDGKSRRDAFRQAKRDAGIPMNQQPSRVYHTDLMDGYGKPVMGKNGSPIQTRNYEYKGRNNEVITIQEHSLGHGKATSGHGKEPHFNVRDTNLNTGNVDGTHGHYNFP